MSSRERRARARQSGGSVQRKPAASPVAAP
eukprot:COSAG06_NODE_10914_length_1596_cov_12.218437_1_plen_29_part_10